MEILPTDQVEATEYNLKGRPMATALMQPSPLTAIHMQF
jgi:hypothetical protein